MAEHAGEAVGMVPAALRHRDLSLFWGGVVLSGVGSQFTTVAMAWQMYALTHSAWQIGLLGLARAVPRIALALLVHFHRSSCALPWERRRPACSGSGQDGRAPRQRLLHNMS